MTTFLVLLLIAFMIATVVVLVRGLATFLLNASADAREGDSGPSEASLKSNKMMWYRIYFQFGAIFIIVLILFVGGARS